jgi:ribosomal protein S27AE
MNQPISEALWQHLTQDVMTEMRAWRVAHPKATLREIEIELDTQLNRMRARMLEDIALASPAADWADTPACQHPTCPDCGAPLHLRGTDTRILQTHGGQELTFQRRYGTCPACGAGLFPPR